MRHFRVLILKYNTLQSSWVCRTDVVCTGESMLQLGDTVYLTSGIVITENRNTLLTRLLMQIKKKKNFP